MTWRYPVEARRDFPTGDLNAALAAIYNHPNEALDNPYLFVARDADYQQIGVVVTDPEGVELDLLDINALYGAVLASALHPWMRTADVRFNVEGDLAAIEWAFPSGSVFPVDAINALLAGLYGVSCRPFVYPVYDRDDEDSELRQVGLLLCPVLDLPGTPSENWRAVRERWREIWADDLTYENDVPWGQKEFNLE